MEQVNKPRLTPAVKGLIKQAIENKQTVNRYELCEEVGKILEEKYLDQNMDFILKRMNMATTTDTLSSIDAYLIELMTKELKRASRNEQENNRDT